ASFGKGIAGGELNYRNGRLNLYGTLNYSNGANQIVERLSTPYPGQIFDVTDDYKRIMKPLQYTAGLDFDIHKNAVLGIQWMSANANRKDESTDKIVVTKLPAAIIDSTMITLGRATRNNSNNTLNLNYVWKIDSTGKTLTLNANRLWFNGSRTNDFNTSNYFGDGNTPTGIASHNTASGRQNITISTAQADVQLPYAFASLSLGGKLSFISNTSDNRFGYFDQDGYHDDPTVSNGFEYREQVQALYASAEKAIGKWSFQAGLRAEFTQTSGYAVSLGSTTTNRYFNLFPTAYIQFQPNADNSWNLNYSKRINRPDYRSLDPFRAYATPYHYSQGNPFLLPSFNHNLEFAYAYKGRYSLTAFYQYERNHFASVWMIDEIRNITSGISLNFADFVSYGTNAMATWQPFGWWEAQVQLGVQQQQLRSSVYA
ncbi:MAG: TonB-dependent receptor, partial [Sphingobacteriales bacterium]